jgi:CheY-like chemotaxis protein
MRCFVPLSGHNVLVVEGDKTANVLVVDDDPVTNWCLRDTLERNGASAQSCLNGESALTAIGARRFDALVVDVYMPGMDGVSLVRKLRAMSSHKDLPVVIVTAGNTEKIKEQLEELKPAAVVPKPFETSQIIDTLKKLWRMT